MPESFQSGGEQREFATESTATSFYDQDTTQEPLPVDLYLTDFPLLYVLPQGLNIEDYRKTISKLRWMTARIARNINQARLILCFANGSVRAKHDLQTERYNGVSKLEKPELSSLETTPPFFRSTKQNKNSQNSQRSSVDLGKSVSQFNNAEASSQPAEHNLDDPGIATTIKPEIAIDPTKVFVVRLQWLYDSVARGCLLPLANYVLLHGPWQPLRRKEIAEGSRRRKQNQSGDYTVHEVNGPIHEKTTSLPHKVNKRLLLSQESMGYSDVGGNRPIPDWVRNQTRYSCQRKQTQPSANESFLTELRLIKHKRLLDDKHEEKVRNSYGRAIASIAAYPYPLLSPAEVQKLPNCGEKFEKLFCEFTETGSLSEADEMRQDPRLQTLELFWKIHGIGPHLAKTLYDKGYRTVDGLRYKIWPQLEELFEDDPIEKRRIDQLPDPGLDREQQQGLKFYDDFLERIPREESKFIASIIEKHLKGITDSRAQAMLVGSFRKGKATSGDVDIVVSHPDESQTANLVDRLYSSLDSAGWIRAKLKISLAHTHRDQTPVLRSRKKPGGASFAALDIALLVWQDSRWPTKAADLAQDPDARNPATCRRVDIIVSPWKSVGCAVLGWSGGITFERDLREYAHAEMNWKFDSSGILDRKTGEWLDVERYDDPETRATSIEQAERRVLETLKLTCFDPTERLTD